MYAHYNSEGIYPREIISSIIESSHEFSPNHNRFIHWLSKTHNILVERLKTSESWWIRSKRETKRELVCSTASASAFLHVSLIGCRGIWLHSRMSWLKKFNKTLIWSAEFFNWTLQFYVIGNEWECTIGIEGSQNIFFWLLWKFEFLLIFINLFLIRIFHFFEEKFQTLCLKNDSNFEIFISTKK